MIGNRPARDDEKRPAFLAETGRFRGRCYLAQQLIVRQPQADVQAPWEGAQQAPPAWQQPGMAQQAPLAQQFPPAQQAGAETAAWTTVLTCAAFAPWGAAEAACADETPPRANAASRAARVRMCFMVFPDVMSNV